MKKASILFVLLVVGCVSPNIVQVPTLPPQRVVVTATPEPHITQGPAQLTPALPATPTFVIPELTPYPDDVVISIGTSLEGRSLDVWQLGEGQTTLMFIGGIHGGYEANSVTLTEMLISYFRDNPADILPDIRLVMMPVANPDGLVRGPGLEGRFNAREVDLNRNWGCDWAPQAMLRDIPVSPGSRPFSEPETVALREYFVSEPPDAVVFYHSALGEIFMGACDGEEPAHWMGELLAEATGYTYERSFDYYEVNGDASNWLAERGIPAAVVELVTRTEPEFDENLAGVIALQCAFYTGDTRDTNYQRLCTD